MATLKPPEAIYYRLSNYGNLTSLVSTRIYPTIAPQKAALPYVTFFQVSRTHYHAFNQDTTTYLTRVQTDAWADDYLEAENISIQVRAALQDYMGSMAGSGDTFTVQRIFFEDRGDMTEMDPETHEITYRVTQDFLMWHE